jgi:hypothetical protein
MNEQTMLALPGARPFANQSTFMRSAIKLPDTSRWPRSDSKKVARRKTSGPEIKIMRALRTREETFWRILNAQMLYRRI